MIATYTGPQFDKLYAANVLLNARARKHTVKAFPGPFSIKGVLHGEATWRVAGQDYRVDSASWLLLDRGERYDLTVDSPEPVETFVVFFADALVDDVTASRLRGLEDLLAQPAEPHPVPLGVTRRLWTNCAPFEGAMRVLQQITASAEEEQGMLDGVLRATLDACADLAAQVQREQDRIAAAKPATRRELHRRALAGKAFLDDTYSSHFDLHAAAREACMAPHHFHRTFAAAFEATPYAYVSARRIVLAKRLLAESDSAVTDICARVGYESLPSFSNRFRAAAGMSPAAYRKQIRNGR